MNAYQNYIEKIADVFYEGLQNDNLKFTKEWTASQLQEAIPHNPTSKNIYRGLNSLILEITQEEKKYKSGAWLTYNQINKLGGYVVRGEKSTPIGFFTKTKTIKRKDENNQEIKEVIELDTPIFMQYAVFNIEQTTGIEVEKYKELYNNYEKLENFNDIEKIEKIIKSFDGEIEHKHQDRAYYSSSLDKIVMPNKDQFINEMAYYSTILHEIGHATGHEKRLNRSFSRDTEEYAKEELRAEIYSYLQAKELGIDFNLENHQSYVKAWANAIGNNKQIIIDAIKDSLKMVKYVDENYINNINVKELEKENNQTVTLKNEKETNLVDIPLLSKEDKKENTNIKPDDVYNSYNKSEYNQYTDYGKDFNLNWEFKDVELFYNEPKPYITGETKNSIKEGQESHIFWAEVNDEVKNKNFKSESLKFGYWLSKVNDDYELVEEYAYKEINLLDDEKYSKLRDIVIPKEVLKAYSELQKEKSISQSSTVDNQQVQNKDIQSTINYAKLPMPKILESIGFEVKRAKSTQKHIVMSDGKDTLIISRGKGYERNDKIVGEGNYIYFNTHNREDKGTIYGFCKNRNIDVNKLVSGAEIKDYSHTIIISDSKYYDPEVFKKYNELESYNKSNVSSLSKIRKINPKIIENFDSIKVDGYKNVVFPSYTLEETKIQDKEIAVITISGMNKKLIEKPLTHDKNGNLYEKPLNSLEEGKSGLSILIANNVQRENITQVITGENSIDNLSYAELKKIDLSQTALISFNGSMKDEAEKAFKYLLNKELPNIKTVTAVFDNDKVGSEYDNKLDTLLKNVNKNINVNIDKSISKDWNDDLKIYKQSLHKTFAKSRSYEKSFTLEMER